MQDEFKIVRIYGENIKRLKVVDITPQEDIQIIKGENGQGKSSVLDLISYAFGGKDAVGAMPIRAGETEGRIIVDLGDLVVKRRFTETNSYLAVETKDGMRADAPQKRLDAMLGSITFDPLQFTKMDDKKQYETLRGLVTMEVDVDELDRQNKADRETRTIVGREVERTKNYAASLVQRTEEGLPALIVNGVMTPVNKIDLQPVDVAEKSNELLSAQSQINTVNELKTAIKRDETLMTDLENQMLDLQQRIASGKDVIKNRKDALTKAQTKVPDEHHLQAIRDDIANAEAINKVLSTITAYADAMEAHQKEDTKYDALTKAIKERDEQKLAAMATAKMPVPGLSFADGIVYFDGGQGPVPFSQASMAQKIRVSTAIAMAMNPKLRVIRIEDASLLDKTSMETIKEMARENRFQVWLECIESSDPFAIHIEDGTHAGAKVMETTKPAKKSAKEKDAA